MSQKNVFEPAGTILVATDFSESAAQAVERALLIPRAEDATLELFHVLPAERRDLRDEAQRSIERLVTDVRGRPASAGLRVTANIGCGETYVEIIRRSRHLAADLIVIGRHGRRTLKSSLLGSSAARVVRKGDVDVLVVNQPAVQRYRRPLIATDLHDAAGTVVESCLRLVGPGVRSIGVVHAYHVPFEHLVTPIASEHSSYRSSFAADAEVQLAALLARYQHLGMQWNTRLRTGHPTSVVMDATVTFVPDLLALGTHGRTGLSHALLGSVAESVLEASPCDVLIARPVRFSFDAE